MKILFAAGGTGGHVFPAIVLAQEIRKKYPQAEILFVGTPRGQERKMVEEHQFSFHPMEMGGLKGKSFFHRIRTLGALPQAFWRSWKLLRQFSPEAVFGIGGYVSGPILFLAALRGFRTGIFEPNAIPGFSNRFLGHFVDHVFVAFASAAKWFSSKKCVVTGHLIRNEILKVSPPRFSDSPWKIFIFGGSQGAHRLNEAVLGMLPFLKSVHKEVQFFHQTGNQDEERVREGYQKEGFFAEVRSFFSNMAEPYQKSHLVIARSGSSVLEIASCGRPAILVPYPFAADNHQWANAKAMESRGAAIVLKDSDCDGPHLGQLVVSLLNNLSQLQKMSQSALSFRKEKSAQEMAQYFETTKPLQENQR